MIPNDPDAVLRLAGEQLNLALARRLLDDPDAFAGRLLNDKPLDVFKHAQTWVKPQANEDAFAGFSREDIATVVTFARGMAANGEAGGDVASGTGEH